MENSLKGLKVAILVAHGFEQSEMVEPKKALEQAGAKTFIISPIKGKVKGWSAKNWGDEFPVDKELSQAKADEFDALLLPGGVANPDTLRMTPAAVEFVKHFIKEGKPIASICHGPWILINAKGVKGKTLTSWPSIQVDLINAGANWVDQQVVVDDNLVTSRKPEDLPAFNKAMITLFSEKTVIRSR
ncbi:MAG: type 1 glutamine amidotransferase [Parachlamydiaceae bacterium]|nr:type 1 glutamine amidotransferase [Parachlamydiaceae bacterium]